jgi:butyryl-CoA dehydrogenase
MTFRAPVDDLLFVITHAAGMGRGIEEGVYPDLADDFAATLLGEAGKFAEAVLAPLNRAGDQHGSTLANGVVTTAPGWIEAYGHWQEGGWNGLCAPLDQGGMGLPHLIQAACLDMWNAANMAFMLAPILTFGAIDAIAAHGSQALRDQWLGKLVSGEWTATMNLTEPQAGSDLAALRSRAERVGDGSYRIFGQKIFITYGEHDMTDNIVHLVLARLPDAPAGTRGISLFLVPKFLPGADGGLGARNDLRCTGVEHKMGIHGSPTCSMSFGDDGGAIGWLIGEENRGLACMFTMMNAARLATALQGVAIGERSFQQALAFASERRQGKAASYEGPGMAPILEHPDVRRMLMTMKALTQAARVICYMTADSIDRAHRLEDKAARQAASERAGLLTPVAKAFSTDIGSEATGMPTCCMVRYAK